MNERPIATMKMGPKPGVRQQPAAPVSKSASPQPKDAGARKAAASPRQSEYDRLMALVEQLRGQFPNKSEGQILALARKILEKEQADMDMWDNVKSEYGINRYAPSRPPTRAAPRPATSEPQPSQTPAEPNKQASEPAFIPSGAVGVMVPNPSYGKQNGLVFDGKGWQDGAAQSQDLASREAEQQFLSEKRSMELEQTRMEMALERLRKEQEMNKLRQDPALAGLAGGMLSGQTSRPLAGRSGGMY